MRDWERFGRNQRSNHMRRLCRVWIATTSIDTF
jgi:hypothetical protein